MDRQHCLNLKKCYAFVGWGGWDGKGGKQHEQKHLVWKNTSMLL